MTASPVLTYKTVLGAGIFAAAGLTIIGGAALPGEPQDRGGTPPAAEKRASEASAAENEVEIVGEVQ